MPLSFCLGGETEKLRILRCSGRVGTGRVFLEQKVPFPHSLLGGKQKLVSPPNSEWIRCPRGMAFAGTSALLKIVQFVWI